LVLGCSHNKITCALSISVNKAFDAEKLLRHKRQKRHKRHK
jgi:hypothetical protein